MHRIHSKLEATTYVNDDKKVSLKKGDNTVTSEELEHLTSNSVFDLHNKNGFVSIHDVEEPVIEEDALEDEGSEDEGKKKKKPKR